MAETSRIICCDALEVLRILPDNCIDMCVLSLPYWRTCNRSVYGLSKTMQSPLEGKGRFARVFQEVYRVLKPNGTLLLNHGRDYPIEFVCRHILAGCPEGGVVLDPFSDSGTTGAAAMALGRRYIGIELNPKFIPLAEERLKQHTAPGTPRDTDNESGRGAIFV